MWDYAEYTLYTVCIVVPSLGLRDPVNWSITLTANFDELSLFERHVRLRGRLGTMLCLESSGGHVILRLECL